VRVLRACVHACVRACVLACVCACVRVCCACMHVCARAFLHACMRIRECVEHACVHVSMCRVRASPRLDLHTLCVHTCMRTAYMGNAHPPSHSAARQLLRGTGGPSFARGSAGTRTPCCLLLPAATLPAAAAVLLVLRANCIQPFNSNSE